MVGRTIPEIHRECCALEFDTDIVSREKGRAERIFRVAAPLLLLCCALFSGLASVGRGRTEDLLWCLSATLTAAASFSGALCFGMPWSTLAQRLETRAARAASACSRWETWSLSAWLAARSG